MSYCTRANIEAVFGVENVRKWADLDADRDAAKIAARIGVAIETATATVNDELRGGAVPVPLAAAGTTLTDITARLAGLWLHESRGDEEAGDDAAAPGRYQRMRRECLQRLARIKAGRVRLESSVRLAMPSVLVQTTDERGETSYTASP